MTPQEELAALRAENEALKARLGNENILHPNVQPKYFNGSLVKYENEVHRVYGRSIAQDGSCTYNLQASEVEHGEINPTGRMPIPAIVNVTLKDDAEPLFDIAEDELEPYDEEQVSSGAESAALHRVSERMATSEGSVMVQTP